MYEKWIADDSEDLKVTKDEIVALQEKIAAVKAAQSDHEDALWDKEVALQGKEDVLTVSHSPFSRATGHDSLR